VEIKKVNPHLRATSLVSAALALSGIPELELWLMGIPTCPCDTSTVSFEPGRIQNISNPYELELELIQTRMIQKPLLWVELGKSACVLVGICELRLFQTHITHKPGPEKLQIAVGRTGCACGAQKFRVRWVGVGRCGCRVAPLCVCCL
jgi:hypothetical protein